MADKKDPYDEVKQSAVMEWLLSLSVSKRGMLTTLSVLLFIFQTGLQFTDAILHFIIKDISYSSQHHTEAIVVFQTVSFYWAVMASAYSLQAGNRKMGYIAILSVGLNLGIFFTRFWYEFLMIGYRAEKF